MFAVDPASQITWVHDSDRSAATDMSGHAPTTHSRSIPGGERGERLVEYYPRLSDLGLAPQIIQRTENTIVTRMCLPLFRWLAADQAPERRQEMGRRLCVLLVSVHSHGICHRDVHVCNVVLDGDAPLLIDLEFAMDSDPKKPCYDLYGPGPSGLPVPKEHSDHPRNVGGVWWDCTAQVPTLWEAFGPLDNFL
jgi:serine/threonine protein kinase